MFNRGTGSGGAGWWDGVRGDSYSESLPYINDNQINGGRGGRGGMPGLSGENGSVGVGYPITYIAASTGPIAYMPFIKTMPGGIGGAPGYSLIGNINILNNRSPIYGPKNNLLFDGIIKLPNNKRNTFGGIDNYGTIEVTMTGGEVKNVQII